MSINCSFNVYRSIWCIHFNDLVRMRVIANLSLLFKSKPLLERYKLASQFGFKLVELPFAYTESAESLKQAADQHCLQHILINTKNDDTLGALTCRPGHEEEFKRNIQITMNYATTLGVSMYIYCTLIIFCGLVCMWWPEMEVKMMNRPTFRISNMHVDFLQKWIAFKWLIFVCLEEHSMCDWTVE